MTIHVKLFRQPDRHVRHRQLLGARNVTRPSSAEPVLLRRDAHDLLAAPRAPRWTVGGARLTAEEKTGHVYLEWQDAVDNEGIYGYEIFRSEDGGEFTRLHAIKRTHYYDTSVVGGRSYSYYVRAYDFAGNRSEKSHEAGVILSRAGVA